MFFGLPGSGKSWLASRLSPLLGLPVIDKDDILESLFESRGVGDTAHRSALSRESDTIFRQQAESSNGALLVSFWHLPGMAPESGTPTTWLSSLSDRIASVHCVCPPELAASRFRHRVRHPGHLDSTKSEDEVLTGIQALSHFPLPDLRPRTEVDTAADVDLTALASGLQLAVK